MSFWTLFVFILFEGACVCVCVLSLHAYWPLHTVTCTQSIQKPVCTVHKNCILIWQHAVSMFLCVRLQFYDVRVADHLVTVSQGALGNHDRHFLKAEKEWPCHDWRKRCYSMIYILLSWRFPVQHKDFGFALEHLQMFWRGDIGSSLEYYRSIAIASRRDILQPNNVMITIFVSCIDCRNPCMGLMF